MVLYLYPLSRFGGFCNPFSYCGFGLERRKMREGKRDNKKER